MTNNENWTSRNLTFVTDGLRPVPDLQKLRVNGSNGPMAGK
jgi:hypothetical protein